MSTEINILKKISENNGKVPIQLIAKQLGIGSDYVRYLCLELLKKGLVGKLKGRDWYKITPKGLKKLGKIEKPKKYPFEKKITDKKNRQKKVKKKVPKKIKKKIKKRIKKIQKKAKPPKKLPSRKKKIVKVFPQKIKPEVPKEIKQIPSTNSVSFKPEKTMPSEKKSKKIIKVFKKLFGIKGN